MFVDGTHYRTIWFNSQKNVVEIIDQTFLPHQFIIVALSNLEEVARAIETMQVRGAPLIGATAAYGVALALRHDASDENLANAIERLTHTRPTAINLRWALERMRHKLNPTTQEERVSLAFKEAAEICDEDVALCQSIGEHGAKIIQKHYDALKEKRPIHILTHCNAGWLATVDWGTALAPIYTAHENGLPVHVWVDETRPRNQGASLTAWELAEHGVPHTLITDNVGGHLMQHGQVDLCIVGSDRTTAQGDVCNKIGTYLKALAAKANDVPFYAALPYSTIDWNIDDGLVEIPIEERDPQEVTHLWGIDAQHQRHQIHITHPQTQAANYAFDVTPARYLSGLITNCGVFPAQKSSLEKLKSQLEAQQKHLST
ncbi:MAG: S-methyl-5-thioribose-1-phosphate isomerase [Myxococcota bacterium]|nr:S-methyl-5-thioribose-1-phosphate isomerase [Myxococcota bacterium]